MNQNQIQEFLAGLDGAVADQVADFLSDHEKVKRPRGRPAKNTGIEDAKEPVLADAVAEEEPVKKKRGRPAKNTPKKVEPVPAVAEEEPVKKKRGRPAKNTPPVEEKKVEPVLAPVVAVEEPVKKKRGRPAKNTPKDEEKKEEPVQAPVVAVEEPAKKKRGRPAKNTPKAEEKKEEPVPAVAEEVPKERKPRKEKEEVNMDLWGDLEALTFTRWIFQEGSSNKFWECADKENVTLVRYGKVGSKGTLQQKTFTDDTEAAEFLKKEILGKQKKGYVRA